MDTIIKRPSGMFTLCCRFFLFMAVALFMVACKGPERQSHSPQVSDASIKQAHHMPENASSTAQNIEAQFKPPPNIIFILADDLGISDINAYAHYFTGKNKQSLFYETPNIDRLASKGISFSQAYANPLCSPTRAAILTGLNPAKLGFMTAVPPRKTYFNQGITPPKGYSPHDVLIHEDRIQEQQAWINASSNTAVDPSFTILPEVLKSHHSAFIGKWHVGGIGVKALQPGPQGFDEVLASFDAGGSNYHNQAKAKPNKNAWPLGWDREDPHYATMPASLFDVGTAGKGTHADYLTDDLTDKALDYIKRRAGDNTPNKKPFFLYLAHFAVHTPLQAPADLVSYYEQKEQRGTLGHNHPAYAGMVSRLDASVGRILDTVEQLGIDKNTLIVFTSDNGGTEYTRPAATDNQPFKGGKATMYEGGIRVPLIVYMNEKFTGNAWRDQVVSSVDFMPSLAEITGNKVPDNIDGSSFIPVLENAEAQLGERAIIWHYPFNVKVRHPNYNLPLTPTSAIRKGDFKMIWDWHGKLELYNIIDDPFEHSDLSTSNPQLTQALFNELHAWLNINVQEHYMPRLNPEYDESKDQRPYPFKDLSGTPTPF